MNDNAVQPTRKSARLMASVGRLEEPTCGGLPSPAHPGLLDDKVVLAQWMLEATQKAVVKNFVMIGAAAVAIGSPSALHRLQRTAFRRR